MARPLDWAEGGFKLIPYIILISTSYFYTKA